MIDEIFTLTFCVQTTHKTAKDLKKGDKIIVPPSHQIVIVKEILIDGYGGLIVNIKNQITFYNTKFDYFITDEEQLFEVINAN